MNSKPDGAYVIIIIIDKTDAGLNGLCIRDITLIYDPNPHTLSGLELSVKKQIVPGSMLPLVYTPASLRQLRINLLSSLSPSPMSGTSFVDAYRPGYMRTCSASVDLCELFVSVAECLACWTQAQKGPGSNRSGDAVG